jgi:hypothetical protein
MKLTLAHFYTWSGFSRHRTMKFKSLGNDVYDLVTRRLFLILVAMKRCTTNSRSSPVALLFLIRRLPLHGCKTLTVGTKYRHFRTGCWKIRYKAGPTWISIFANHKAMRYFAVLSFVTGFLFSLPAQAAVGDGYWSTSGRDLVDAAGNKVRIAGVRYSVIHGRLCGIELYFD